MSYAFTFDASACTGCKACQVACKDKNDPPPGLLWRRVYEVTGGEWERKGAAWTNTVFAYNVSAACNHCAEPACVQACPTGACSARADGIVWIDGGKCIGCAYCAWVCPYSAPQFSHTLGRMTKCDFCRDLVDEGRSPACVAACPMRALDFVDVAERTPLSPRAMTLWTVPASVHPFPLPPVSRTKPRVAVTPHAAMSNGMTGTVANREEVRHAQHRSDLPLIAFTLLAQAAAGSAVLAALLGQPDPSVLIAIGALTIVAAAISLLHLGNMPQAWRAARRPRNSALSREVVVLGVFFAVWLLTWISPAAGLVPLALCGFALVYAMGDVYSPDGIPLWDAPYTRAAFAGSALWLGLAVHLVFSGIVTFWLAVAVATAVTVHQWIGRRDFYSARQGRTM